MLTCLNLKANSAHLSSIPSTTLRFQSFQDLITPTRDMSNSKRLAFAIIEHLSSQLKSGAVIGDAAESLDGE